MLQQYGRSWRDISGRSLRVESAAKPARGRGRTAAAAAAAATAATKLVVVTPEKPPAPVSPVPRALLPYVLTMVGLARKDQRRPLPWSEKICEELVRQGYMAERIERTPSGLAIVSAATPKALTHTVMFEPD